MHPEEIFIKAKELSIQLINQQSGYNDALEILNNGLRDLGTPAMSDEFKVHRAELLRVRALLYWKNGKFIESTIDLTDSIKLCDNYYKTWKLWFMICYQ